MSNSEPIADFMDPKGAAAPQPDATDAPAPVQQEAPVKKPKISPRVMLTRLKKAKDLFKHQERERKDVMLLTHDEMKKQYVTFYQLGASDTPQAIHASLAKPLVPGIVNRTFVDIFDDLLVLNRIMRDDKRGRWADAWEFGVGVVFGILILMGSILIAIDATKENPIECTTSCSGNSCTTNCEEASNKIGTSGMLMTGSWIVVAGGLGFILVFLWRIIVKIRLARKHHATLRTFIHDFATDGSSAKEEEIAGVHAAQMGRGQSRDRSQSNFTNSSDSSQGSVSNLDSVLEDDDEAENPAATVKGSASRMYRQVPSFYAPRSAYHRVARGYGSPLMC